MDISMDISMDIHIHGKPGNTTQKINDFNMIEAAGCYPRFYGIPCGGQWQRRSKINRL